MTALARFEDLRRKLSHLQLRVSSLRGQESVLTRRKAELTHSLAYQNAIVDLAPSAMATLEYLQAEAHAKAVGQFQELLSSFIADVVPDAGTLKLELGSLGGVPTLDILIERGEKELEGILDGNGGGLTNVVVAGLSYAALSRTSNRRLLVLDEPDCWLADTNVPAFTKVIADVANPTIADDGSYTPGYQTLMISHNDITLMDPSAHVLNLTRLSDGHLNPMSMSGFKPWQSKDEPGIRFIELVNVRTHKKTKVTLCPGLNVLTGDINTGKSTLIHSSLRAMAYGESDDTLIAHGAAQCVIRLGLENDIMLEMVRRRTSSPKVLYRMYVDGAMVHEGRPATRNNVPSFISDALNISRVDGLDIQLRSQKEPIFLLNEPATVRARLMAIGTEAGFLQDLMEEHRANIRKTKESVKHAEIELNLINRQLTMLSPLGSMSPFCEILQGMLDSAKAQAQVADRLTYGITRLSILQPNAQLADVALGRLPVAPIAPAIQDTKAMERCVSLMSRTKPLLAIADVPAAPVPPAMQATDKLQALVGTIAKTKPMLQLPALPILPMAPVQKDMSALSNLINRISSAKSIMALPLPPTLPEAPEIKDTQAIKKAGIKVRDAATAVKQLTDEHSLVVKDEADANLLLEVVKSEVGFCPVCEKPFGDHNHG